MFERPQVGVLPVTIHHEPTKILIWGKTYPELSTRHVETVCTGACLEDGRPIRLYPIDLRYLDKHKQYRLYDWIRVPIARNHKDPRPESYKARADAIEVLDRVESADGWAARREVIMRDPSWHFDCLEALKVSQRATKQSIGMVPVREVSRIELAGRSSEDRQDHEQKARDIAAAGDLFVGQHKELEFLPWRVRLHWRCHGVACPGHSATILDWGLNELGRRDGKEQAIRKMEELVDPRRHELRLYLGNLFTRQHIFSIIGLWYPTLSSQFALF